MTTWRAAGRAGVLAILRWGCWSGLHPPCPRPAQKQLLTAAQLLLQFCHSAGVCWLGEQKGGTALLASQGGTRGRQEDKVGQSKMRAGQCDMGGMQQECKATNTTLQRDFSVVTIFLCSFCN